MVQPRPHAAGPQRMLSADFEMKEVISKGSFGTVYKVVRKTDKKVFALKQVKLSSMSRLDRQEALDEARMLSKLRSPYIIQHYDSFTDKDDVLNIVMEFASGGTVYHVTRKHRGGSLEEARIWKWAIQAILGLHYIHSKRIVHRDIKTLNLFLDAGDNIKLGDFGIARTLTDDTDVLRTVVGTPFYLSPELCEDKPYNEKTDIWALGVCLYEMCTGKHPITADNEGALIKKICKGVYEPLPASGYRKELRKLVADCLTKDQMRRPTTSQLLRSADVVDKAKALGISLSPPTDQETQDTPVYDIPGPSHAKDSLVAADASLVDAVAVPRSHPFYSPTVEQERYAAASQALERDIELKRRAAAFSAHAPALPQHHMDLAAHRPQQASTGVQANLDDGLHRPAEPLPRHRLQHPFAVQSGGYEPGPRSIEEQQHRGVGHDVGVDPSRLAAANAHAGMQDNVKGMLGGQAGTVLDRHPRRLRPEQLPAAGVDKRGGAMNMPGNLARPASARPYAAPYGQDGANGRGDVFARSEAQEQEEAIWTACYQRPQYARKRATDLLVTGPNIRSAVALGTKAPQATGVYAHYAGSETTTTTYIPAMSRI